MFMSKTIAYLLVFLVVQCPFQCYFADCCSAQSAMEVCDCCHESDMEESDGESSPLLPDQSDECPCGDCFCKGAITIVSTDASSGLDDSAIFSWGVLKALDAPRLKVQLGQLSANTFFLPLIASGHRVRAALSSWQI